MNDELLHEVSQFFCDYLCLGKRCLFDVIPFRAAIGKCACDVKVDMWDRLMGGNSVVLPYGDAFGLVGAGYRSCGSDN
nr:hypothetical protein [Amycolatopsis sp. DSM 110486]